MINDRTLTNLGIICILASAPHKASKNAVDGTLFQDVRLSLESKLLSLVVRNFDRLKLWRYLNLERDHRPGLSAVMTVGDWRTELEAQLIASMSFERHVRPLYRHLENYIYIVNPNQEEEMFLYYNLSPNMVIELSRELGDARLWFLGHHEVMSSIPLGDVVEEVRRKYTKEM